MPRYFALIALALLGFSAPAFAIYKCTDGGGKITYSDVPCPTAEKEQKLAVPESRSRATTSGAATSRGSASKIDFGKTPDDQLYKSVAVLQSLAVDGRQCERALKVVSRDTSPCLLFMSKMTEGGEWSQLHAVLKELLQNESFVRANFAQFEKINDLSKEVAGYSQFAKLRLLGS